MFFKNVQKLQWIQNAAARLLYGMDPRDQSVQVLFPLQWLPVCCWAQFSVLMLSVKAPYSLDLRILRILGAHTSVYLIVTLFEGPVSNAPISLRLDER